MSDKYISNVACSENQTSEEVTETCPKGTVCRNGKCVSNETQEICQNYSGDGGKLLVCSGYSYTHSSGIIFTPNVKFENNMWTATIQVNNHGTITEHGPGFSGEYALYFTTPDKSETISLRVYTYKTDENRAMRIEIQPRWGLDPALLE